MADIILFGHQEKPESESRQFFLNLIQQMVSAACIKTVNRILSDIERHSAFDFEATEFFIRNEMHRIGAQILERILEYAGEKAVNAVCKCGGTFRNKKKRDKSLVTVLGEIKIERDIVQCDPCGKWKSMQDKAWDIEGTGLPPGVDVIGSRSSTEL